VTEARRLLAGLHLLDRQLVDREDRFAGKVDDVELSDPEDGSPPHVVAILSGPGTLGRRLGGRLGRLAEKVSLRLTGDPPGTGRIKIEAVADFGSHLTLSCRHDELDNHQVEHWVAHTVIAKLPGGGAS
jgi:hypothetical protein